MTDPDRAALMAVAAEGMGHTAAITKKMIVLYETEKTKTAAEAENRSDIRYIPKQPYRIELALGLARGTLFTEEENEKAKTNGGFVHKNPDAALDPKSHPCTTLSKTECGESGYDRCVVKNGWISSSCEFNEMYLSNDVIPGIEQYGLLKKIPVRALLLDTAKLLGRGDIQFACSALVIQFQRGKVSYGDLLAAIYMVYMCKKFDIQAIGCKQVRRYIWAMARGDQRTARVDIKSRIQYVRALIGIGPNDTVTRYDEEGMNKTQIALSAIMLGAAAATGYNAWNAAQQQNAIAAEHLQNRARQIVPNEDPAAAPAPAVRMRRIIPEPEPAPLDPAAAARAMGRTRYIVPEQEDPAAAAAAMGRTRYIIPEGAAAAQQTRVEQPPAPLDPQSHAPPAAYGPQQFKTTHQPRVQFGPETRPLQSHAGLPAYGPKPILKRVHFGPENQRVQFGPENRPPIPQPQSQWHDVPPAEFATDGQRAEYLLRDLPEFYTKAEAREYMHRHILPQLPPTQYTKLWGLPMNQPREAVVQRMNDLIRILPE